MPSDILKAKNQVIPFVGKIREAEFSLLAQFCDIESPPTGIVKLFWGSGGIGKTRLVLEWVDVLKKQGWEPFGFTLSNIENYRDDIEKIFHLKRNIFIVIDYSESIPKLGDILQVILSYVKKHEYAVRIVLLARSAGEWWQDIKNTNMASYLCDDCEIKSVDDISNRKVLFHETIIVLSNLQPSFELSWREDVL